MALAGESIDNGMQYKDNDDVRPERKEEHEND
jgi:hypothetical protein